MAKADRRVQRTRELLQKALLELIAAGDYDEISIADIAARANVGRTTFYLHFGSKDDLFLSCHEAIVRDFRFGPLHPHPLTREELLAPAPAPELIAAYPPSAGSLDAAAPDLCRQGRPGDPETHARVERPRDRGQPAALLHRSGRRRANSTCWRTTWPGRNWRCNGGSTPCSRTARTAWHSHFTICSAPHYAMLSDRTTLRRLPR